MRPERTLPTLAIDGRYLARPGMGIHVYLMVLLQVLAEAGVPVTVLCQQEPDPQLLPAGVEVVIAPLGLSRSQLLWEQWSVRRFLRAHDFDCYLAPANKGLPLAYRGRTRLLLVVHDLIPLAYYRLYFGRRPFSGLIYLFSTLGSVRRAGTILAVSRSTAADIERRLRRPAIPTLIPAGRLVGPAGLRPPGPRRRQFIYNGGLDPRKNVDALLQAFARFAGEHPGYRLVLMGRGYEALAPRIAQLGIADRVELTGYVSDEVKWRRLAESCALVYPSLTEGYGLPIVEAFLAGIPVVCGSGGAQAEIVGEAGIVLDELTPAAIAGAMARVTGVAPGQEPAGAGSDYGNLARQRLDYLCDPDHERALLAAFGVPAGEAPPGRRPPLARSAGGAAERDQPAVPGGGGPEPGTAVDSADTAVGAGTEMGMGLVGVPADTRGRTDHGVPPRSQRPGVTTRSIGR
jgi:glycosyltransferase involved in cell wall biosynthesis